MDLHTGWTCVQKIEARHTEDWTLDLLKNRGATFWECHQVQRFLKCGSGSKCGPQADC